MLVCVYTCIYIYKKIHYLLFPDKGIYKILAEVPGVARGNKQISNFTNRNRNESKKISMRKKFRI